MGVGLAQIMSEEQVGYRVRRARTEDLESIMALDTRVTEVAKPDYWHNLRERYQRRRKEDLFFFVAESDAAEGGQERDLLGFVIGEVRAWEFGSASCGWVFAISVDPEARQAGLGEALLGEISKSFQAAGVDKMRTMVRHRNNLMLSFFRSEGLAAGPYLQLEKDLN